MDDILDLLGAKEHGIKGYDDLNPAERETYHKAIELQERAELTLEKFRQAITDMRHAVALEIANLVIIDKKTERYDIALRARLKNYILIEQIFDEPRKAREMIRNMGKQQRG